VDRCLAHLHLEIKLESEPIAGVVTGPRGDAQRFRGWIELAQAIEQARAPESKTAAARSAPRLGARCCEEAAGRFPDASSGAA
jgi:hypothetical protein